MFSGLCANDRRRSVEKSERTSTRCARYFFSGGGAPSVRPGWALSSRACHPRQPSSSVIAVLFNPNSPEAETVASDAQTAARSVGQQIIVLTAAAEDDFDRAFEIMVQQRAGALLVGTDPFFTSHLDRLLGLAARHAIPAIYDAREYPLAGGLMSYGSSIPDAYRQLGVYTGRILKGEKPAHLPVLQPTKFETAKALGIEVPPSLLARADEVIE